ncbi:MAG: HAMP domain-containing histidine kinase [Clostridiales bacterium]|nr:HAMP domain-containing histidine kinase [Clostridiales bacterium]
MKKTKSLQLKLTLATAFLIIISCLTISYSISSFAVVYMSEIEDSAIAILPNDTLATDSEDSFEVALDPKVALSDMFKDTRDEFWAKSLLITLIITIISSLTMYLVIGHALRPLQNLGKQMGEIQIKNLQTPIVSGNADNEIAQLTNAFNKMLSRLGTNFAEQKQFSANAAHELRTPLAVIRTRLEVLGKSNTVEIEEYKDTIAMITTQIDRLSHVIDVLLEMTELKSAEKTDHISLADMVEEILYDLAAIAEARGITVVQTAGNVEIIGNDTLIYRAIYNLIENAIKYNRDGGKVIIAIEAQENLAVVRISDTGSGIEKSEWEHIFEPFFRIDKSRSRSMGGAGLGLALVREIAKEHSGNAKVVKSSTEGTTIELSLQI